MLSCCFSLKRLSKMNIVVIGQGAIGLLWYAHLQNVPAPAIQLSLLTSHKHNIKANHFAYSHFLGLSEQRPYQQASHKNLQQADVIIICVKAYQVNNVIDEISTIISPQCALILAHNGMGTLAEIQPKLSKQQAILSLLTTHGCTRAMPLHIIHTGLGETHLGLLQGSFPQHLILTQLLNSALPNVFWQDNIIQKQWIKLAINCVINPITALTNSANGELTNPLYSKQINTILTEIVAVANAEKQILSLPYLQQQVLQVAKATSQNCSSMRADILAKRRTEIDYINGFIHHLGQKHHIKTPENTHLWHAVLTKQQCNS
jgi:2-dehydropantoate 2-reductase